MLREFFCDASPFRCAIAWFGLCFSLAFAGAFAYVKVLINAWYGEFYNLAQDAAAVVAANRTSASMGVAEHDEAVEHFWSLMSRFFWIATISIVYQPLASFIAQHYAYAWRYALMESYIARWDAADAVVEGASQRIHEDTQRFASALQGGLRSTLEAMLTMAAFMPVVRAQMLIRPGSPHPSLLPAAAHVSRSSLMVLSVERSSRS